ncbi:MAG: NAD(P)/FAD-dependent oxidoreductase, partial [Aeromicrobium sp.]
MWLDSPERPPARPALDADAETDLAVVGGGFTGLWTALMAKERQPDRTVLLLEADRIGGAATGRNGGFCSASLTHGEENGRRRFPDECDELLRLGMENLREITETVFRYGIDCDLIESGELHVATRHHELAALDTTSEDYLDVVALRQ